MNIGHIQMQHDRINYNKSLLYSDAQQLLLNIVRARYADPIYFITVNNIVSQFQFTKQVGALGGWNIPGSLPRSIGGQISADSSLSYQESPTITYTPLQGQEYVKRLLLPIDLGVIHMLLRSGWGVERTLRLFFQRVGSLDNAAAISRSISSHIPEYKDFYKIAVLLGKLHAAGILHIELAEHKKEFYIKFKFDYYKLSAEQRRQLRVLHLSADTPYVNLTTNKFNSYGNSILVETRSLSNLMNFLSASVIVPEEDLRAGYAKATRGSDGNNFDWTILTKDLLHIYSSRENPDCAFISVFYRNKWFYIKDSDHDSKETINILLEIIGIYQGDVQSNIPLLTVT